MFPRLTVPPALASQNEWRLQQRMRTVVGNIRAGNGFSYSAVGETVNIGARFESVPDDYRCGIVCGPATAASIADHSVLCELDWIKVKGKPEAITAYEVVVEKAGASAAALAYPAKYRSALDADRAGRFAKAEECWPRVAHPHPADRSPPLGMAERTAALRAVPPEDWDGVLCEDEEVI